MYRRAAARTANPAAVHGTLSTSTVLSCTAVTTRSETTVWVWKTTVVEVLVTYSVAVAVMVVVTVFGFPINTERL